MINSQLLYQLSYKGIKLLLVLPSMLSKDLKLVQRTGIEPVTNGLSTRHSTN